MKPLKIIKDHFALFWTIVDHLKPFGTIRDNLGQFGIERWERVGIGSWGRDLRERVPRESREREGRV